MYLPNYRINLKSVIMDDSNKTILDTNQAEIVCSNCSAKLTFAPGTSNLKCEYCGTENEIEADNSQVQELDFKEFLAKMQKEQVTESINIVKCDACGAEVSFSENTVSDTCPFCGNHLVVKEGATCNLIKPKSLLPFKIDQKAARQLYRTWLGKLWFAPGDLKAYARQNEKLSGMYIPYWTYDSQTSTSYSGERGDDYQVSESYTDDKGERRTRQVTKTRWSSVRGNVRKFFDDVLVIASKSLPVKYLKKLEPWDLENLVSFDEKYLSGFVSESYQIPLDEGFGDAQEIMKPVIKRLVESDIGGDHQRIHHMDTAYSEISFKHILLPVWLSAYRYNGKVYRFLINARTGEVRGERPYSVGKIILAVLAGILIIGGIGFAIWYFGDKGGQ